MDHAGELAEKGLEVGALDGRVAALVDEVPHRGDPLPVDEREGDERERYRAPTGERERQERAAQHRPEPGRVGADRRVDEQEHGAQDPVGDRPGAEPPLLARNEEKDRGDEQRHGQERREREREPPRSRERVPHEEERDDRRGGDRDASPATAARGDPRSDRRGEGAEEPGDRARQRGQRGDGGRPADPPALKRDQGTKPETDAERERDPARDEVGRGGRAEPGDPEGRPIAVSPPRKEREQHRRRHRRDRAEDPRADEGAERRIEKAVAEK